MKLLEVSGSSSGCGEMIGESLRGEIVEFRGRLGDNLRDSGIDIDSVAVTNQCARWWNSAYETSPQAKLILAGIAKGSDQSVESIQVLNSFLDLMSLRASTVKNALLGCTTIGAVSSGEVVLAQNYDMERFYRDYAVSIDATIDGKRTAIFSFAGVLACAGLASEWGVAINFLHARDVSPIGRPHAAIVFEILMAETIVDALGGLTFGRRSCGAHFLVAYKEGLLFSFELTGERHAIRSLSSGTFAHTNHYLAEELRDLDLLLWSPTKESSRQSRGSSLFRLARAEQLLAETVGKSCHVMSSLEDSVAAVLKDTCGGPAGICENVCTGNDITDGATIATIVMSPLAGRFRVKDPSDGSEVFIDGLARGPL
jgi:hypothetical protein